MSAPHPILERLAAKKGALDAALRDLDAAKEKVDRLSLEVGVWEEAARLAGGGDVEGREDRSAPSMEAGRRRGPKGIWRQILRSTAAKFPPPADFGLRDIETQAETAGHSIKADNVRSQMWNYAKVGIVDRTEIGRFRFTESGLGVLGVGDTEKGATNAPNASPPPSEQYPPAAPAS